MWIGVILLLYFFVARNWSDFPHARVLYFRICTIFMLSAVCSCAGLLLSKVIYQLKVHAYFNPHDNVQASDIMYLYFSWLSDHEPVMTPTLVWLITPWLTGILVDHTMRLAVCDLNQQSTLTCTFQNGGEEKAVAPWSRNKHGCKG